MDKKTDETRMPEPSLFDGFPDTVPQPPAVEPAVTAAPAEAAAAEPVSTVPEVSAADPAPTFMEVPAADPVPTVSEVPAAEPVSTFMEVPATDPAPVPDAPALLVDEPAATASLEAPAKPQDVVPEMLAAAPVELPVVVDEPQPATAQEVPSNFDEYAAPTPVPADADEVGKTEVVVSPAEDVFDPAPAAPAEPLPLEQSSDTDLGRPEATDVSAEVGSIAPMLAAQVASITPTLTAEDASIASPLTAEDAFVPPMPPVAKPEPSTGAWWTIPMICVGLMMVACALIVGQVEVNRQVAWQRNKLKIDLEYLQEQIKQNEEFLKRIQTDPTMAERLAQRQMKQVREGSAILDVPGLPHQNDRNPFQLTTIPPPKPLGQYQSRGGLLTTLFADQQRALVAIGLGLLLVAAGLVLGGPNESEEQQKVQ